MRSSFVLATLAVGALASASSAATLKVPSQFATIQAAIIASAPGDTVLVAKGTYYENVLIATASITLKGSGANTIIDARPDPNAGTGPAIRIVSPDVTVTNLRVRHAAPNGFMLIGVDDGNFDISAATNVTLSKVTSEHPYFYHVRATGADGLTLDRCTFRNNGRLVIDGNGVTVHKCSFKLLEIGLSVEGDDTTVTNNKFEYCSIGFFGNGDNALIQGNTIANAMAFGLFFAGTNSTITSNTIKNGMGIFMPGGNNIVVSKNKLTGIGVSPDTAALVTPGAGMFADTVTGLTIEKNTITDCLVPGVWLIDCVNTTVSQNTVTRTGMRTALVLFGGGPTIPQARGAGILIESGTGHSIVSNKISSCPHDGLIVTANGVLIDGNQSSNNAEDGISLNGDNCTLSDNVAKSNQGEGLDLTGGNNTLANNTMSGNRINWRNTGALGPTTGNSPAAPDSSDNGIEYDTPPL
jgi:parallel beta-helix repeat protein